MLCDLGLKEWNPGGNLAKTAASRKRRVKNSKSQAEVRREVFERAGHRCKNCGSDYALEVDHICPQAYGGSSVIENLRVLCRSCNQRAAIEVFSLAKMDCHLNGTH